MPNTPAAPVSPFHTFAHSLRALLPGLTVAVVVALAATFVAEHYGGPKFLYALLIGISLHFLSEHGRCQAGIEFAAKKLVRFGVALLGARIALADVSALGGWGVAALAGAVVLTIGFGLLMARLLAQPAVFGLISGGATGICGISAAMAISATLPQTEDNERYTLMTAIGVAALSTVVMVLYPLLVQWAGWPVPLAGLFLGGAIHDVAQVVGAGNIVSPEVAQAATLAKMMRVAMLVPVVLALALIFRDEVAAFARAGGRQASRPPLLPLFLLVFVALVVVNSLGWIAAPVQAAAGSASQWALVISIAALGVKTSFQKILALGWRPVALLVSETLFVALFMLAVVALLAR
ncbi:YeiH family protein [Vandammella animalimorsus]|uniref:Putative sulfate exporter family transporter n=1 Tax=Vandammella animalimorsus TaxID=2029117 RepID=A0A2A2AIB4_9BURK|nr:putative sulfate exporter family transporter [Vandammella animalimorsus]PAT37556.1 putative sulfate exporter family transporter [Vandammella animalimorsus]